MRPARFAAAALLLILAALPLPAQADGTQTGAAKVAPATASAPLLDDLAPKTENPWSRFEIVSLGSIPIVLFYTDFSFDLQRYITHGFDRSYAPWPIKDESYVSLTKEQTYWRLGTALGLAMVVGAADAYLHDRKIKAAKRLREARASVESIDSP
jgi:hypothetical protein